MLDGPCFPQSQTPLLPLSAPQVGGIMSMAEAEGRPPRPPGGGGSVRAGSSGSGSNVAPRTGGGGGSGGSSSVMVGSLRPLLDGGCPLASAGVYSLNVGRGKVRALPPLPAGRFGGTAVVAGARLHYFGGWATPDRATRLAVPAMEHWSIGLNAGTGIRSCGLACAGWDGALCGPALHPQYPT